MQRDTSTSLIISCSFFPISFSPFETLTAPGMLRMPVCFLLAGVAFFLAAALPLIVISKESLVSVEIITVMMMRKYCDDDDDEYE